MNIKHEHLHCAVMALAAEMGQAGAANTITENYLSLGGGSLPLVSGATWNNQQNIFRPEGGWVYGRTPQQRKKMQQLIPAILMALPRDIRCRLSIYDTIERRAMLAARNAIGVALDAHDDAIAAVYRDARLVAESSGGPASNQLCH